LRRLKFAGLPELAVPLAALLPTTAAELIVPVPLHPRRLRERQFNQAAALAYAARDAHRLSGPIELHALARIRDTPPQTSLGPAERRRNLRGAFLADARRVRGRAVLLIDDVATTGATLEACARALRAAGSPRVSALTLARAVP
jgi:ComF family protein